jgi:hypothetical protein
MIVNAQAVITTTFSKFDKANCITCSRSVITNLNIYDQLFVTIVPSYCKVASIPIPSSSTLIGSSAILMTRNVSEYGTKMNKIRSRIHLNLSKFYCKNASFVHNSVHDCRR